MDRKSLPSNYDSLIYFGVAVGKDGIDTTDDGYKSVPMFLRSVNNGQKKLLTIRLLNQDVDEKVLHDMNFQAKVIHDGVNFAKENGFDGVVVDLEYKALAFDEVIKGISNFSSRFANEAHSKNMKYYQLVYGDSIYRFRPFDVSAIGSVSDGIFVMAYDFHKANGTPGPNFPMEKMPDEDYSFSQMVEDFTSKVPISKLTIVFGLFGYDWAVDDRGGSVGIAESMSTNEMLQKFIARCAYKNCNIDQNKSGESHVTYDDGTSHHIVWFDNLTAVDAKETLLKAKGINQTAYWAWGYF